MDVTLATLESILECLSTNLRRSNSTERILIRYALSPCSTQASEEGKNGKARANKPQGVKVRVRVSLNNYQVKG